MDLRHVAAAVAACAAILMPGPAAAQQVREFFNSLTGHYFITGSESEAAGILAGAAGPGWKATGYQFFGFSNGSGVVCRFYAPPPTNSHFYTADAAECDFLKTHDTGWRYEGIAFRADVPKNGACPSNQVPVYRMYNNRAAALDSNHRFNADDRVVAKMKAQGWVVEGVAFCSGMFSTPRAFRTFDVFLSPSPFQAPPNPFCNTAFSGNERCIALTALVDMTEHLFSWSPPDLQSHNPAYTPDFAAKTGWISNVDTVYSASFAGTPAEHSFVESFAGGQVVGVHLVGADRRFGNHATISPAIRTQDPTGVPLRPWGDRGEHDVIVNFQLKIATVVRRDDSAQAYGGPVLEFVDTRSGQRLLVRALAYGSQAPADFIGRDPVSGHAMVSTTFAAPRVGRAMRGNYIACAFARLATGGCPASGIDYTYRLDQDDFAQALTLARAVNGALSGDIADYVLVSMQLRNETSGDAELGLLENFIQLITN